MSIQSTHRQCGMENKDDSLSFVTLGMFIIDEFSFLDEHGRPLSRSLAPQESYLGCRVCFLPDDLFHRRSGVGPIL